MENSKEIWKPINGFEWSYEVSNLGKVKSLDRYANSGIGIRLYKGILLKPVVDKYGYLKVQLCRDNKQTTFNVHRLVYEAFNGKIPEGMQVNHIDEDKTNNRLDNLNLITCKENVNWGTAIERSSKSRLNRKDCSKAVVQYTPNGTRLAEFESLMDAERKLGICNQNICSVLKGRTKTAGGYKWAYKQ